MNGVRGRRRGFTLIEVLVSVFLLAVVSALCYETLNYVTRSRDTTKIAFERMRAIELAVHMLVTDLKNADLMQ